MKKFAMLLVPVFVFGLFSIGCAPEPAKKAPETKPAAPTAPATPEKGK